MVSYKLYKCPTPLAPENVGVKLIGDDGSETFIPMADENRDYQTYLAWLADGNTPEAADE